jgi:hypothetical protein
MVDDRIGRRRRTSTVGHHLVEETCGVFRSAPQSRSRASPRRPHPKAHRAARGHPAIRWRARRGRQAPCRQKPQSSEALTAMRRHGDRAGVSPATKIEPSQMTSIRVG